MHRDQNLSAQHAETPATEPDLVLEPARADPAAAASGAAPLTSEHWVMATDQTAMLPLIRTPKGWGWLLALCLPLVAAGVVAYAAQMIDGLGVTGMSNRTPWSFYIVNFVFFIGASAGGIVVASLAYALKFEHFKPVARLAEITALTCLTLASVFITLDVGRPDRLWHLVRYGNLTSPLVWDVTSITVYGVLAFALVYFSLRSDLVRLTATMPRRRSLYRLLALGRTELTPEAVAKDKKVLHVLALLSVPAAVAVHTVTAWILGLVKAQEGWHTAIIAPMFIVSAVVSGVALTIVAAVVSRWALGVRIGEDVVRSLARILFLALPVLGYLLVSELVTGVYPRKPGAIHVFSEMTFGRWGLVFWLALAAFVAAFALLGLAKRLSLPTIGFASLLVVVAVLAERWNIVLPSLTGASHFPYAMPGYTPSAVELVIAVAAYAGGVLAYVVLSRVLPMVDLSVEREAHR